VCRPVERAEKGARGHGRIDSAQGVTADALRNERPHAALVPVALRDDEATPSRRQSVDFEMRGRPFDLVDEAQHVRRREIAQAVGQRPAIAARRGEGGEQTVERSVLAEEENFVLAAKIVIQVAGRQTGGDGDLAHTGGGEAPRTEDARRGPHDLHPAGIGPD
jgi:hypothetical protein